MSKGRKKAKDAMRKRRLARARKYRPNEIPRSRAEHHAVASQLPGPKIVQADSVLFDELKEETP